MTFNQYLRRQTGRPDRVGDLARDFVRDRDYDLGADVPPKPTGNAFDAWRDYFIMRNASEPAMNALRAAYREYVSR